MNPPNAVPTGALDRDAVARLRDLARDVDPAIFAEILTTFRDDAQKYLSAIQQALAANDAGAVERSAHAMKGASMNTGALTLGGLSARMEDAAKARNATVVGALLLEMQAEINRVNADIALELSAAA